jgi:2-iminobutanoate/2-iminopropanoate deaminase
MARSDQTRHYRHALEQAIGFSQVVQSSGFLLLSGMVSMDANAQCVGRGDMKTQVQTIYTEVGRILVDYGLSFEHVVRETIYTTDLDALIAAAPIRLKFFERVRPPAATWVRVAGLYAPEYLLEVEITAEVPEPDRGAP